MSVEKSSILVVEDELLIALSLQDMLEELGFAVDVASTLDQALKAAQQGSFRAAILDYNLGNATTEGVAEVLTGRRVPFAIASGMDHRDMRMGAGAPMLGKPYDFDDVRRVVGVLTESPSTLPAA
jgi:DNA-binding response OmpR family regulator